MKPILFNTEMVQAILDGRKSVTRRVIKPQPAKRLTRGTIWKELLLVDSAAPYQFDDVLWVQETWFRSEYTPECAGRSDSDECLFNRVGNSCYGYKTQYIDSTGVFKRRPSIHMPREAARLFLRVTDVRVERLGDMNGNDLEKEGIETGITHFKSPFNNFGNADRFKEAQEKFSLIWNSTIKKSDLSLSGWDANPWAWVIEFERCEKP